MEPALVGFRMCGCANTSEVEGIEGCVRSAPHTCSERSYLHLSIISVSLQLRISLFKYFHTKELQVMSLHGKGLKRAQTSISLHSSCGNREWPRP